MIDPTHPHYNATIQAYCEEVYADPEFAVGDALLINDRAVEEHEWAVGEVFKDQDAVIAVIPSAPYELEVYHDPAANHLFIVRTPDNTIPLHWELKRTIGARKTN